MANDSRPDRPGSRQPAAAEVQAGIQMAASHTLARSPHASGRAGGFTLVELMVTLALGVVLMTIAVPSYVQFRRNADLSDATSAFIMSAGAAKSAALKSGRNAFLRVTDPVQGWRSGWTVFVDNDHDNVYSPGDEIVIEREALSPDLTVTATGNSLGAGYLMYTGSGFPRSEGNAPITNPSRVELATVVRTIRISVSADGWLRSCRVDTDPGC